MGPTVLFHKDIKEAPGLQLGDVPQFSYREKAGRVRRTPSMHFPVLAQPGLLEEEDTYLLRLHNHRGRPLLPSNNH